MTKQLQECINSGQVSAAQVVAHAEAGELAICPICGEGRVTVHIEADDLIFKRCDTCGSEFAGTLESRINKRFAVLTAALEAERERFADLMEAVEVVLQADMVATLNGGGAHARHVIPAIQELRKTRAATQEQNP